MGHSNKLPDNVWERIQLQLDRLEWIDGDYISDGSYFGGSKKDHIWCAWDPESETRIFVRAKNSRDARLQVLALVPGASLTQAIDDFILAYIEAALWSSRDERDNQKRAAQEAGYKVVAWKGFPIFSPYVLLRPGEDLINAELDFEHESEAWERAWRLMGGGCDDTALDENYSANDIAPETLARIQADCIRFQTENSAILEVAECRRGIGQYTKQQQAGHDFWLSRNSTGVGFFDGDWGDHGDVLHEAALAFGEINLYVGDDGKIYD